LEFEILFNFPFSSDRKRMGIILREKSTDKTFFLVKGADFIMKDLV
jgi:phospholipid-translocating ATPase